jgi:hypothetical protein
MEQRLSTLHKEIPVISRAMREGGRNEAAEKTWASAAEKTWASAAEKTWASAAEKT